MHNEKSARHNNGNILWLKRKAGNSWVACELTGKRGCLSLEMKNVPMRGYSSSWYVMQARASMRLCITA